MSPISTPGFPAGTRVSTHSHRSEASNTPGKQGDGEMLPSSGQTSPASTVTSNSVSVPSSSSQLERDSFSSQARGVDPSQRCVFIHPLKLSLTQTTQHTASHVNRLRLMLTSPRSLYHANRLMLLLKLKAVICHCAEAESPHFQLYLLLFITFRTFINVTVDLDVKTSTLTGRWCILTSDDEGDDITCLFRAAADAGGAALHNNM